MKSLTLRLIIQNMFTVDVRSGSLYLSGVKYFCAPTKPPRQYLCAIIPGFLICVSIRGCTKIVQTPRVFFLQLGTPHSLLIRIGLCVFFCGGTKKYRPLYLGLPNPLVHSGKNNHHYLSRSPLFLPGSRELTYPTLGKGNSSSKVPLGGDMLVPRRF